MRSGIGAVFAAVAASACCLGPVVFTAIGSGALAAASTKLAAVRPLFLALTTVLLGFGFYRTHRASGMAAVCDGDACTPETNRKARIALWIVAAVVMLVAGFPYYAHYLF